jgi:endonuclease/exonuclease/phosphatase family metal-dependent hydrolase
MAERGYGFQYFFPSFSIWEEEAQFGMAILSKFPIKNTLSVSFGKTPHSEGLMYADIEVNGSLVRVFSVHLESFRMNNQGYVGRNRDRNILGQGRDIISGLKQAYHHRTAQVDIVKAQLQISPYPVVLCGNLGDVPNSYTYFNVKDGLNDAFLAGGNGLGRTFRYVSPTLRVDYILADARLRVNHYARPKLPYSDHYPIIVNIEVPKN